MFVFFVNFVFCFPFCFFKTKCMFVKSNMWLCFYSFVCLILSVFTPILKWSSTFLLRHHKLSDYYLFSESLGKSCLSVQSYMVSDFAVKRICKIVLKFNYLFLFWYRRKEALKFSIISRDTPPKVERSV